MNINQFVQLALVVLTCYTSQVWCQFGPFGWPMMGAPLMRRPSPYQPSYQPTYSMNRVPFGLASRPLFSSPSTIPAPVLRPSPSSGSSYNLAPRRRPTAAQSWRYVLSRRDQWRPTTTIAPERLDNSVSTVNLTLANGTLSVVNVPVVNSDMSNASSLASSSTPSASSNLSTRGVANISMDGF